MRIFQDTPELNEKLKVALRSIFHQELNLERIKQGEVNYAYKVTNSKAIPFCHARVFKHEGYPDVDKLLWISKELKRLNIPQAKILYIENSSKDFPNGFMVSEWIEGVDGWQSIKDDRYSLREFTLETAKILSRVHTIKVAGFGRFYTKRQGYYNTYMERILGIPEDGNILELFKANCLKREYVNNIVNLLLKALKKVSIPQQAVLVHADPTPDNIIVRADKSLVLVDWDDSEGSWWVRDLAFLTYWHVEHEEIKSEFLAGYGKVNMSGKELKIAEFVEWIQQSFRLLWHYKYSFVEEEGYTKGLDRLERDVEQLRSLV